MGKYYQVLVSKIGSLEQQLDTLTSLVKSLKNLLENRRTETKGQVEVEPEAGGQEEECKCASTLAIKALKNLLEKPGRMGAGPAETASQQTEQVDELNAEHDLSTNDNEECSASRTGSLNLAEQAGVARKGRGVQQSASRPNVNVTAKHLTSRSVSRLRLKKQKCNYSERSFGSNSAKVTHERIHTGEQPFSCLLCDRRFSRMVNVDAHMRTHTKEKRAHACTFCDSSFPHKCNLTRHIKTKHT